MALPSSSTGCSSASAPVPCAVFILIKATRLSAPSAPDRPALLLPLPALRRLPREHHQRGERVGVRGSNRLKWCLWPPLTLTLSPCLKRHGEREHPQLPALCSCCRNLKRRK